MLTGVALLGRGVLPTKTPACLSQFFGKFPSSCKKPFQVPRSVFSLVACLPYRTLLVSKQSIFSLLFIALSHLFLISSSVCLRSGLSPRWSSLSHLSFQIRCDASFIKMARSRLLPWSILPCSSRSFMRLHPSMVPWRRVLMAA